jgi:hypothetical protein
MGALSSLNLASNDIGSIVGWNEYEDYLYRHSDGRHQKEKPAEEMGKPEGIIAIANVIPDMGAMTSLNLASNKLGVKGATIIGEAIKVKYVMKCVIAVVLVPC